MFFAGMVAGLITMYKLMGDQIEINVKKIKNKRTVGQGDVVIPITTETPKNHKKRRKKRKNGPE